MSWVQLELPGIGRHAHLARVDLQCQCACMWELVRKTELLAGQFPGPMYTATRANIEEAARAFRKAWSHLTEAVEALP